MNLDQTVKDLSAIRARARHLNWEPFMTKYDCQTICEIGVREGGNFLKMIRHNPKIAVAVDSWIDDGNINRNDIGYPQEELNRQYEEFKKAVSNKLFVKIYREYSFDAVKHFPDNYFDLVYIDGDHSYEGCLRDIENWYPKVKEGKFLVGDDFREAEGKVKLRRHLKIKFGVIEAVKEFASKNDLEYYELPNSGWAIIKEAKNMRRDSYKETPLCKLALKYHADKCPRYGRHTYTPYYYNLFKSRRNSVKKVLEIGIGSGASLRMWRDFFPKAKIYGADYRPDLLIKEDRILSILCDQRRKEHLKKLTEITGTDLDLVVDDGSHRPRDQVYSCLNLMPFLNKKVTYVIEDVADPRIVNSFGNNYEVEVPLLEKNRNRRDNKLVVVRRKPIITKEIIFYTDNKLPRKVAKEVQSRLAQISTKMSIPIITTLEKSTADIIFFCEANVLYHPSHFDFIPPQKDKFFYNQNWWMMRLTDGHAIRYDACKMGALCAYRPLLLKEYHQKRITTKNEPGTKDNNFKIWLSDFPIIEIKHDKNLTSKRKTRLNWLETDDEIPGWGRNKDLIAKLKRDLSLT